MTNLQQWRRLEVNFADLDHLVLQYFWYSLQDLRCLCFTCQYTWNNTKSTLPYVPFMLLDSKLSAKSPRVWRASDGNSRSWFLSDCRYLPKTYFSSAVFVKGTAKMPVACRLLPRRPAQTTCDWLKCLSARLRCKTRVTSHELAICHAFHFLVVSPSAKGDNEGKGTPNGNQPANLSVWHAHKIVKYLMSFVLFVFNIIFHQGKDEFLWIRWYLEDIKMPT